MFVAITNTPRDYAWGSTTAIPELLGMAPTGAPQAELWLGTHPASPARTATGLLSEQTTLPFLLKVLAAAAPLSLQAHPTAEQAVEGFARENAAGVPIDAPERNYRDDQHKPEMLYALTPFTALCGFRAEAETIGDLARLGGLDEWSRRLAVDGIGPTFEWLLSGGDEIAQLVARLVAAAAAIKGSRFDLIGELAMAYPADPGIAVSLMLNLAELSPGEAIRLPAGNVHAYVRGVGIELMAASDNVLRGGLSPKHVDVAELVRVVDFAPSGVPYLRPTSLAPTVDEFAMQEGNLSLLHVTGEALLDLTADAVAICTSGAFDFGGITLEHGGALLISGERAITIAGRGELFIATTSA